jgi:hypothetical protein
MLSGFADAEADAVPSADVGADEVAAADADEVADEAGVDVPGLLLPLLLLLQAAAVRTRTLSPAAAMTRFMVDVPPLFREKCEASRDARGVRAPAEAGGGLEGQIEARQEPDDRKTDISI